MTTRRKYTDKEKRVIFNKAKVIRGKNAKTHRKDSYNNVIYIGSYGKSSRMGWEIDHIKPRSRGGPDSIGNLQPLRTETNRKLGNKLKKGLKQPKRQKRTK